MGRVRPTRGCKQRFICNEIRFCNGQTPPIRKFFELPGIKWSRPWTIGQMLFSHRPRTDEFQAAAMPHMADIYRIASRLLGAGTGADDVVQDVYLQASKSFGQFERG